MARAPIPSPSPCMPRVNGSPSGTDEACNEPRPSRGTGFWDRVTERARQPYKITKPKNPVRPK